jgi:hypothetical protein
MSQGGKEYPTKSNNANCIGHILCRNCLLEHVIEGKHEGQMSEKTRKKT